MRAESSTTNALAVFAASSMLLICGAVSAQTIIPLDQQRSVNTFLIVPQCLDKTFDEESAKGFGPLTVLWKHCLAVIPGSALDPPASSRKSAHHP